ncbi:sterol desaturase family protein [Ideonella dechloratans]|uniref:Sterol desaturase family protein n=1 Tax=Ideonella dechloratans TaxID=36863 RepID=A0A643F6X6_IDEDE|nr:sterol desaturase family protein [Ideonella dechloratans]KAB0573951.1 sterol desaturase family protein [Ideonella dechloratans]UFU12501.1 sterol desaturase family protein [Ideonella dechloratans]
MTLLAPPSGLPLPRVLGGLLGLVLAAALVEALVLWHRGRYDWRALATTLGDLVLRRAAGFTGLSLATPLFSWAWVHRLTTLDLSTGGQWVGLFLLSEAAYYGFHRASHRVRWFWASHAVHHSSPQLTLAAALRLGWLGKLSGSTVFFVPLVWLGFAPAAVLGVLSLNLLYQFWLHAEWLPRLGPLEWVLNTPSHHRVHHACNPRYVDHNYGGVLIVFDRLFGTFQAEQADEAPRYGLAGRPRIDNPIRLALSEWQHLGRDLWAAPGWRQRLAVLVGPPAG